MSDNRARHELSGGKGVTVKGKTETDSQQGNFIQEIKEGNLSRRQVIATAGALGIAGAAGSLFDPASAATATSHGANATVMPTRGGNMTIGIGFGVGMNNDPHPSPAGDQNVIRNFNVFNLLFWYDKNGNLKPALALSATANSTATVWTLKLRSGVTFHDGSAFGADDVVYSIQRIIDPATKAEGKAGLASIDPTKVKKIDNLTVEIGMNFPFSILPDQFATKGMSMIKAGTKNFDTPNGTGSFKFVSGDANTIVLKRNANFWQAGGAYLSTVTIKNVMDKTARLNGVKTGELDTIYPVDAVLAASVASDPKVTTFVNKTRTYLPLYFDVSAKPYADLRAREALKLAADRTAINRVAYASKGLIGNDMFGIGDPGYPVNIKQRAYDPEKAKALWKAAGNANAKLEVWTADQWPAQQSSATVYVQQAKKAGINMTLKTSPADQFDSKIYGVKPFSQDYWNYRPILTMWQEAFNPSSEYFPVTKWAPSKTQALYSKAVGTGDEATRNEICAEMLTIFHKEGPYVVWGFQATPDLYTSRIGGQENSSIRGLNGFHLETFYIKANS